MCKIYRFLFLEFIMLLLFITGCDNNEKKTNIITNAKETVNNITTYHKHKYVKQESKEATCLSDGNIEYYYCEECGKYFVYKENYDAYQEINKDDIVINRHNVDYHPASEATCLSDGNIEYWYCNNCDKYFNDQELKNEISVESIVIKAACSLNKIDKKEPSCFACGNVEYFKCSVCGKYYIYDSTIEDYIEITESETILNNLEHEIVTGEYNSYCKLCNTYETIYYGFDGAILSINRYELDSKNKTLDYGSIDKASCAECFTSWNTKPDGSGDNYENDKEYDALPNALYAQLYNVIIVESINGLTSIYDSFDDIQLVEGDTLLFTSGVFDETINIDVNNIKLNGYYHGVEALSDSRFLDLETIIKSPIKLKNVSTISIDGIFLSDNAYIEIVDGSKNLTIMNNIFKGDNSLLLYDTKSNDKEIKHQNIEIKNNLFSSTNSDFTKDIYLIGLVNDIFIDNNVFENTLVELNNEDYCIKIDKLENGSQVKIQNNSFKHKGSNYLVSLMEEQGTDTQADVNIIIKENTGLENNDVFLGNGFKILHLSNNSKVLFMHNTDMCFSRYYNAIYFSNSDTCKSTLVSDDIYPEIIITYNQISGDLSATNLNRNTTLDTNYIEIGLGVPSDANNITFNYNYFNGVPRSYAFGTNESQSSYKCKYIGGVLQQSNTFDFYEDYNNKYVSFYNFIYSLETYSNNTKNLDNKINAYYNGVDNSDIKNYISNFDSDFYNKFEIQNGKLVYIGNDEEETIYLGLYDVSISNSIILSDSSTYQDSIVRIAYQYYYQAIEIQYDMKNKRRNMYATPEDATSYRGIYLDCSSYVNSIYYNLFGIDIIDTNSTYTLVDTNNINKYAQNNYGVDDSIILYAETSSFSDMTTKEKEEYLKSYWDNLEIGDLVCYRHGTSSGSSGHIMIYIGDNMFLHCTGSSFELVSDNPTESVENATTVEKTNGAIQLLNAKYVFTYTTSSYNTRYLFNDGVNGTKDDSTKKIWSFSILRPLNKNNLEYTSQAVARINTDGLSIEKKSNPNHMSNVNVGDIITYTISITNKSNYIVNNVTILDYFNENEVTLLNDSLPTGTIVQNNEIKYIFYSLQSGSTINFTYSVRVNELDNGYVINSSSCTVNGLYTNKIYHFVTACVDNDAISSYCLSKINSTYNEVYDFYYDVWNNAGIDISDDLISSTVVYRIVTEEDNPSSTMVVSDLYGGTILNFKYSNQIRLVKDEYLSPGDIILTRYNDSDKNKIYQYFMYVNESCILEIAYDGTSYVVKNNIDTSSKVDTFLNQLIAYLGFAVLRPTLLN